MLQFFAEVRYSLYLCTMPEERQLTFEDITIVNEGKCYQASLRIEDGRIKTLSNSPLKGEHSLPLREGRGGSGLFLLPGIIDGHVHMREPGLTHKATMESETRAAARGGVTTVLDMPNVVPQTTSLQLLEERYALAEHRCHVNYGFYLGATNDNLEEIKRLDPTTSPGVKVFMGSSTGGMLVDKEEALRQIFRHSPTLIMTHCEQEPRDHEACYRSTSLAVRLAKEAGARLHVAHISTARELELFEPNDERITAEACLPHLLFTNEDFATLGTRIKCHPAIKTPADREALRKALTDGHIRTIGTDHAPHLLSEKQREWREAPGGMPMVQFSLPAMLSLVDEGVLSIERLVELMCHNPARLYNIKERGFIREGYWADLTLVRRKPWTLTKDCIESRCGWSPLEGRTFNWQVEKTWVNGKLVWDGNSVSQPPEGKRVIFDS